MLGESTGTPAGYFGRLRVRIHKNLSDVMLVSEQTEGKGIGIGHIPAIVKSKC